MSNIKIKWTNTDAFRASAIFFKENGTYCKYPPGSRAYKKFWDEERKRALEGYTVDGRHITGYHYWYLNYCVIQQVIPVLDKNGIIQYDKDGNVQGDKITDFPLFWDSDVDYFNYVENAALNSRHCVVLKARRKGYSYKNGSMLTRNYFLVPGSKSYAIASEQNFLLKDGVLAKAYEMMSHVDEHTAFAKKRDFIDRPLHKRASYKWTVDGVVIERGYKSEIIGMTLKNDVQRIRGISGKLILFEEAGKFPNLLTAWNIAKSSVKQGNKVYGTLCAFGTGGTEQGDFGDLQELFSSPEGYEVYPQENIWEDGNIRKECAFFVPDYLNLDGYYDHDGNSDIPTATEYIKKERKKVLDNTRDTNAFKRHCAEHPMIPTEAMMKLSGNRFPIQDLSGILARLELDSQYEKSLYKGRFTIAEDGTIEFKQDDSAKILYKFPHKKEDNLDTPVILYEQPYKDPDGKIPFGMYIAGTDPYDHDHSVTGSLGSTFIINKLTGRIVAEYSGRPETAKQYYEQVRRLLIYFNARALYENNLIGMFNYFESQNSLHLLCLEPIWLTDIVKNSSGTRKYGLKMSKEVKSFGEGLIHQWLIAPYDAEKGIQNMHKIRSIPLLEELIKYDPEGNFDRVMALMCVLYQLGEERRYVPEIDSTQRYKTFTQKDFFNKPLFQKKQIFNN